MSDSIVSGKVKVVLPEGGITAEMIEEHISRCRVKGFPHLLYVAHSIDEEMTHFVYISKPEGESNFAIDLDDFISGKA